jgi:carbonic anhydrase/acetyltransferase-like protein (isoleucine patch superfamily)
VPQEPIRIEGRSIIGYGAKVHGGEIKKGVFIGANSMVLRGVKIGENSLVAAGSILTENMEVPPRSLVMGAPAKVARKLNDEDIEWIEWSVALYMKMLEDYKTELKEWEIRYTI